MPLRLRVRERLLEQRLNAELVRRYAAEADARASEAKFRGVVSAFPDVVFIVGMSGLIEFTNDRATNVFGYSLEELVGQPLGLLIPERLRDAHDAHLQNYFAEPMVGMREAGRVLWCRRKDGAEFPAEISLSPIAFADRRAAIATVCDLTNRKALEARQQKTAEDLCESEERLRCFVKYSPAAVAMLDKQMRYLVASDRWLADYDLVGDDLLGRRHDEVFPNLPADWLETYHRALAGESVRSEEDSFPRPDGTPRWLRWEVRPWRDATDDIGGIVLFTEDITERLRLEVQLQQAQKMEAIGQLTGGVAHDFNNLLTVIIGNSEVLLEELLNDEPRRKLLEPVIAAAERGASLTQLMLAFARRQPLEPTTFDINEVVTRMNSLLRRTIGESVEIDLRLTRPLWKVTADMRQLESAVANIVLNARDAMPNGGMLMIETANADLSADYVARNIGVNPGRYVMLALTDTGTGIAPELRDRIFEPFFTTKEIGKGTGLGLSMVHGFVKQTGGHIKVYSELGHGTTLKIYLPRADDEEEVSSEPGVRGLLRVAVGVETILVVEDDPHVRVLTAQQLRRFGYHVTEAADGPSALRAVEQHGAPDLLFTDVIMPGGLTGRQLADRIKQIKPEIKVLFTSGYTEDAILHQGRLDPGVHLLQKPYRSDKLAQKVREVLDL